MRKIRLLLVAFIALFGASSAFADKPVPKASPLATDGETVQYLYNVGKKAFFIGANDWNTRASYNPDKGYKFKVKDNGNGTFTLTDYPEDKGKWMDCFWDGGGVYVDNLENPSRLTWNIEIADDGSFKISNSLANPGYLGVGATQADSDTRLYFLQGEEDFVSWIAVSEEDYAEWLESFTEIKDLIIDQQFTSIAELDGQQFSILNEDEGKAFCFGLGSSQDMNYASYGDVAGAPSYAFKLEAAEGDDVTGYYYLRTYKPNGEVYAVWGDPNNGYFNSQPANQSVCFTIGKTNKTNGQDIVNGAVWDLIVNSEGKFAIKNIGTDKYLKDSAPAKYDEPTYFTLCAVTAKSYIIPVGQTALNEYKQTLADAQTMATMFADDALIDALTKYAYENVINEEATAESVAAATEALLAAMEYKLSQYYTDFEAGQYYVIDVETGLKMAAGHKYGTQGIVNELGLDLTLTPNAEKHSVTFDTQVFYNDNNHFLGSNLYMDAAAYGWYLEYQGFGFFITNGIQYINLDEENNLVMSDTPREWYIMTAEALKAQRLEEMAEATAQAPVDATFLIQGANFNRNDARNNTWNVSENCTNKNLSGGNQTNNCAESYHSLFTISQTIEGAPAGIYKMTVQGFYRQDGDATEDVPVFFAQEKTMSIPAMGDLPDYDENNMNSMGDASVEFTDGKYAIDPIEFEVTEDGILTIGVRNETATNQWVIFDNFQLTYYGPSTAISELEQKAELYNKTLEKAKSYQNVDMAADVKETLNATIAAYEAKTLTTVAEYDAAIAELNAVIKAAEESAANPGPKVFPEFNAQGYLFNLASGLIINSNAELKDKNNVDKEKDLFTVWQKGTEAYNAGKVRIAAGKNADGTWASLRVNADGEIVCFDENYSRWDVEVADGGSYYIKNTYTNAANSNKPGYLRANTETGKLETVATADEYCMWQFLSWEEYDALTTSISSVVKTAPANAIFNVAGQQMNGLQKGINIVGGKKVYIK